MASSIFIWPGMFTVSGGVTTFTNPVQLPDGALTAVAFGYASDPLTGWYRRTAGGWSFSAAGTLAFELNPSNGFWLLSGAKFYSGPTPTTGDAFFYRSGTKTWTLDADGVGGALTLLDVKGPLTVSANITSVTSVIAGAGAAMYPGGTLRSYIESSADGIVRLTASQTSTFNRLTFGPSDGTVNGASLVLTTAGQLVAKSGDASVIPGYGRVTAQVAAAASIVALTVPASDGTFTVSGNVNVTTSTTHSFSLNVTYTDETNTARTLVLPVAQLAGAFVASGLMTNITGAGPYESAVMQIRCKASTVITILTSGGGTYTTVTYNAEGSIRQVA